ncbi:hypothetical protein HDU79_004702 [Rhizoclosmatium sp. JEL0117]|nr:hypothetical protein HDU79_004702 [Rhizoclosmatium sp. JEL0117]
MGGGVNISKREEPRANFNAYLDSCHKETIKKEMRHHVIHEEYVPPQFMKKNWILADKPNNIDILHIVKDDPAVRAELPARQKFQAGPIYRDPFDPRFSRENGGQVLESQELGWYCRPLMKDTCPLFKNARHVTEITQLYAPTRSMDGKLKRDKKL